MGWPEYEFNIKLGQEAKVAVLIGCTHTCFGTELYFASNHHLICGNRGTVSVVYEAIAGERQGHFISDDFAIQVPQIWKEKVFKIGSTKFIEVSSRCAPISKTSLLVNIL